MPGSALVTSQRAQQPRPITSRLKPSCTDLNLEANESLAACQAAVGLCFSLGRPVSHQPST
jgi:hypothetical protein